MSTLPAKSILSAEEIQKKFSAYKNQMAELETRLVNLNVSTQQDCDIATETLTKAKTLVKSIDEIQKDLKAPYTETSRQIESYFKKFAEPLNKAVKVASDIILNFKTIEANKAKEQEKENLKKVEEDFKDKIETLEKLSKIALSTIARLFGGMAKVAGKDTLFEGVNTLDDCTRLRVMFEQKFPSISDFGEMAPTAALIRETGLKALEDMESTLRKMKSPDKDFLKTIYEAKIMTEIASEQKRLNKTIIKAEKTVTTAAQVAMKGTRKEIKFVLTDISKVPLNYLELDETAIKNWIASNRELIKKRLDGSDAPIEFIKGIQFYYDKKVIG
jgi:hypothetical protein